MLLFNIDQLAPIASNTLHFNNINAYFNAVKQLYMNVKSILDKNDVEYADQAVKGYFDLVEEIDEKPKKRTKKSLRKLLRFTEEFNFTIMNGLHRFDYFFRVGSRQNKGLTNVNFHTDSIFNSKKMKGDEIEGKEEA